MQPCAARAWRRAAWGPMCAEWAQEYTELRRSSSGLSCAVIFKAPTASAAPLASPQRGCWRAALPFVHAPHAVRALQSSGELWAITLKPYGAGCTQIEELDCMLRRQVPAWLSGLEP